VREVKSNKMKVSHRPQSSGKAPHPLLYYYMPFRGNVHISINFPGPWSVTWPQWLTSCRELVKRKG